jgi:hypothetical protein
MDLTFSNYEGPPTDWTYSNYEAQLWILPILTTMPTYEFDLL